METKNFALGKQNLILIAIGFVVIIVGFLLMLGSGSTSTEFDLEIFSFRRIVIAPFISFVGFIFIIYAILKKEK